MTLPLSLAFLLWAACSAVVCGALVWWWVVGSRSHNTRVLLRDVGELVATARRPEPRSDLSAFKRRLKGLYRRRA